MRNQRGVTLVEIMIAMGLLMAGAYVIIEGVNQVSDLSKDTKVLSATERQINMIVDNIRTGLGSYQITYDDSPALKEAMLDVKKLPMAWTAGAVKPVKDCVPITSCPVGRYGFVVQPMGSRRGLYIVSLRMTHPEWKEPFREYEFLVTVQ